MKKSFFLLVLVMLVSLTAMQAQSWTQIGQDIDGDTAGANSGSSVALSSDGSIVAIGAPYAGNGIVKVYQNVSGTWTQIGQDIVGKNAGEEFGKSVSISSDGSIVAIGAPRNSNSNNQAGSVRIYRNESGTWTQMGQDINGDAEYDWSGTSVSLSSNGLIVAIGAYANDGNVSGTYDAGQVRIYQYNSSSGNWVQIGSDIFGEPSDQSGWSVSLNSDGSIVAIGAKYHNGSNGNYSGCVRVYQNKNGTWSQIGSTIEGEAASDYSGWSVSLSSDGSIVAIGAIGNDGNGSFAGHVRVYQNNNGTWTQIGTDIDGEAENDRSGYSVSLSSDGSIVAIGAIGNDGSSSDAGHVRVYQNNNGTWTQIGADIDGEAANDNSGYSVSLSSNGTIVAIGAPYNDANGSDAGQVRVYGDNVAAISDLNEPGIVIYPNPSTGDFIIKNAKNYKITISDITGRIIYNNSKIIDGHVHLQTSGIYIINFKSGTREFSTKVIIEK